MMFDFKAEIFIVYSFIDGPSREGQGNTTVVENASRLKTSCSKEEECQCCFLITHRRLERTISAMSCLEALTPPVAF